MNVKELKRLLNQMPDDLEVVMAEKGPFSNGRTVSYTILNTAKMAMVERTVSGNYLPDNNLTTTTNSKVRVVEMVYD